MDIQFQKADKDFTLIIFGASGSLAKLKIFPALYQLEVEKRLPVDYRIVGYGRTQLTNEEFHKEFQEAVRAKNKNTTDEKILAKVLESVFYVQGQYDQKQDYENLKKQIEKIEGETAAGQAGNQAGTRSAKNGLSKANTDRIRISYFSVPPSVFKPVIENLAAVNFDAENEKLRLIIEKPFGYDLESAKELKKLLLSHFEKEQLYLLDHYLGKESVFNILSLRYANAIIARLIQGQYISNIQINGIESLGIEGRANYFDHVGTLRDMIQSHLFQILAFLTMNLPEEINSETIHREKVNLIQSLKIRDVESAVIRGQYKGYAEEKGVKKDSKTETYIALRMYVDHQNWQNIPIYLRSGKKLKQQWTSIVIEFKPQFHQEKLSTNKLIIQLQPGEKIEFHMLTKVGGSDIDFTNLTTGRAIYCSGDCLEEHGRLLLECIKGSRMLFLYFEEVEASWKMLEPLLKHFENNAVPLYQYETGSNGPKEAEEWMRKQGFQWFNGSGESANEK